MQDSLANHTHTCFNCGATYSHDSDETFCNEIRGKYYCGICFESAEHSHICPFCYPHWTHVAPQCTLPDEAPCGPHAAVVNDTERTRRHPHREGAVVVGMASISTVLILVGITEMPYAYYVILRTAVCLSGLYGFSLAFRSRRELWLWICGGIAVLYNPVLPFKVGSKGAWEAANLLTLPTLWIAAWRLIKGRREWPVGSVTDDPWAREKTMMYELMPFFTGLGILLVISFCIGVLVILIQLATDVLGLGKHPAIPYSQ